MRKIRVLIADDLDHVREGLAELLTLEQGLEVVAQAEDGNEAVSMVEELRPDVVVMDALMPVMNGLEATRLIKSKWPQVKVIVLTMYSEFQSDPLVTGADAVMIKGCRLEELIEAISHHEVRSDRSNY